MKLILFGLLLSSTFCFGQTAPRSGYKIQGIELAVSTRKPEQLSAFYSARGLPQSAITLITEHCFITVGLRNDRKDALWLELDNWRLIGNNGQVLPRVTRKLWEERWEKLGVPSAARATFGWTLLPEVRDLQPDEPVGGNLAITPPGQPFTLLADFYTGAKKSDPPISIKISNLTCES